MHLIIQFKNTKKTQKLIEMEGDRSTIIVKSLNTPLNETSTHKIRI